MSHMSAQQRPPALHLSADTRKPFGRALLNETQALLTTLLKKSATDFYAFSNLAHAKSEDGATRASGGESAAMSKAQLRERFGPAFEEAISKLTAGTIAKSVIETDQGFYLAQLVESRPAAEASFGQVREGIAQQLRGEKKNAAWQKFVADLEKSTGFTIDDSAVRNLKP